MNLYIKVGSITNAQRGNAILRSMGYKPVIRRIENPTAEDGCGHALQVYSPGNEPISILEKSGISVRGVEYR